MFSGRPYTLSAIYPPLSLKGKWGERCQDSNSLHSLGFAIISAMKTIICEDCGAERKTRYSNTKYCLVCRMARNLKFIAAATSKCGVCDKSFAPLKRGEVLCGECDDIPASGDPRGTCGLCKATDVPIVNEDISVCKPCSTDPEKRTELLAAVMMKRKLRKEGKA